VVRTGSKSRGSQTFCLSVGSLVEKEAFRRFCDSKEWLPGYATYVTRGPLNGNVCWDEWQRGKDVTRSDASDELHKQFISFVQFVFFEQWKRLKNYANNKGIYIAGDMSYSVALESCDLWKSPRLFEVDPVTGKMKLESGSAARRICTTRAVLGNADLCLVGSQRRRI
jgi:4-alpha-glucanotransferase